MFTAIDSHPLPFDQDEIDEIWAKHESSDESPHVDTVHEEYKRVIGEHGEWEVFRCVWPFGDGKRVTFWNRAASEGFTVTDAEGRWHELVNVFAEIVEEETDCRDAGYSSSVRPSGATNQSCDNCGDSWSM
jgi:hypothetical protein